MGLCRLCLNHSEQFIEIFSEQGRSLNIATTIAEYFLFEIVENDTISTTICQKCWCTTADFQQFQSSIKMAQESFFKNSNFLEYDHKEFESQLIDTTAEQDNSAVEIIAPFECLDTIVPDEVAHAEMLVEDALGIRGTTCKMESTTYTEDDSDRDVPDNDYDSDYGPEKDETSKKAKSKRRTPSKRKSGKSKGAAESSSEDEEYEELDEEEEFEDNDEYSPASPGRSCKRQNKSKREQDDARIRSVCNIFCNVCSAIFQTFNEMSRHCQGEHETKGFVMCCDRKFTTRCRLLEHIECHLNPNAFQCDICKSTFSGRFPLKKHMDTHMTDDQKPFMCEKCPHRYTKAILLARHVFESHSPDEDKKFACELCDKKYLTKGKLAEHNKRSHYSVPEICDFCGKVFKSIYNLNVHRTEVHMGLEAPKMQCNVCGTWLKEKYLKKHLKRHKAGLETCTVCGKVLQNKNSLGNHMRNVHGNRMHQCAVCGKTFSKPLSLREHMALHTGQDLYTCPYCPKTFKSGANMHSHRKKIHFENWEKDRGKRLVTGNYT